MAISFPLSLADFWDTLGVKNITWMQQDNTQLSGMGSGQILQADLAPQLRIGDVQLRQHHTTKAADIEAMIEGLMRSKGTFYAYDPRICVPVGDPFGNLLNADGPPTVLIDSLPNPASMSLKGLPANYHLNRGSMLSFNFGTDGSRRAYHRVLETAVADAEGVTEPFEVTPFIMGGAAVDTPVTLIKASMKAIIRPQSLDINTQVNSNRTNITFSIVQKI